MNISAYRTTAELLAVIPGRLGLKLRHEWYARTLARCGIGLGVQWMSVLKWPDATVGDYVGIGAFNWLMHCDIGSHVITGTFVRIHDRHGYCLSRDMPIMQQPNPPERVRIGNDVWIGDGAIVMADVADGCVIGAGAVVITPTEPHTIYAGVPARKVGERT